MRSSLMVTSKPPSRIHGQIVAETLGELLHRGHLEGQVELLCYPPQRYERVSRQHSADRVLFLELDLVALQEGVLVRLDHVVGGGVAVGLQLTASDGYRLRVLAVASFDT